MDDDVICHRFLFAVVLPGMSFHLVITQGIVSRVDLRSCSLSRTDVRGSSSALLLASWLVIVKVVHSPKQALLPLLYKLWIVMPLLRFLRFKKEMLWQLLAQYLAHGEVILGAFPPKESLLHVADGASTEAARQSFH